MNCSSASAFEMSAEETKGDFWQIIFSVLGPFDIYGASGRDPLLRSRRELVVQIFQLVDYPDNLQISVAAMHAIADMAESPIFMSSSPHSPHKLYSILEAAGELPAVMEAFVRRLEREEDEQVCLLSENGLDALARAQEEEGFAAAFGLANLVRLQIVDFLVRNAAKPGYNLAHHLLGFGTELLLGTANTLKGPDEGGIPFNCLHIILELLAYGLGRPSSPLLVLNHPSLGQKCYELLVVLLGHASTGRTVANYLRDREDFYRNHLAFISKESIDPTDVGFTVYELHQKALLIEGAAIDLNLALSDGAWTVVRRLAKLLVRGLLEKGQERTKEGEKNGKETREKKEGETDGALGAGLSILGMFLSSTEQILTTEYLSQLSPMLQEECLMAVGALVRACVQMAQLLMSSLDRIPYDHVGNQSLQCHLLTSLAPLICRLLSNPTASQAIIEQMASLSLSLAAFLRRINGQEECLAILAGDELISLTLTALQALLRPDTSLNARGYLYACCVEALDQAKVESQDQASSWDEHSSREQLSSRDQSLDRDSLPSETLLQAIRKELARLLQIAASDATLPAIDTAAWKTMALTFIKTLLDVTDRSQGAGETVMERIARLGLLKSIVASIRSDDRQVLGILATNGNGTVGSSLNILFLWRSKFALLERVALVGFGGERLVELGMIDVLAGLRIFGWQSTTDTTNTGNVTSSSNPTSTLALPSHLLAAIEWRWHQILCPVLSLLRTLAHDPARTVRDSAAAFCLTQGSLLERLLRVKGALPSNPLHLRCIALASSLISVTLPPDPSSLMHRAMANLVVKCINALSTVDKKEQSFILWDIIYSAFILFRQAMAANSSFILVGFTGQVDNMARNGMLPISVLSRLLETCNEQLTARFISATHLAGNRWDERDRLLKV